MRSEKFGQVRTAGVRLPSRSAPAVFVAACTEDDCHDLLRSYPEDAFLAEVLVGAFEAAGAARSWPFPAS